MSFLDRFFKKTIVIPSGAFDDTESLEWLKDETHDLAINRFSDKKEAIQFIKNLYKLGSPLILVSNIESSPGYNGEGKLLDNVMHSDVLLVKLPDDHKKCKALIKIYKYETKMQGFPVTKDQEELLLGEEFLEFWWD